VGKIPYELLEKAMSRSEVDKQRVLRRLLSLLKPIWPLLIIGLALSILLRILNLIPPYLMKMLVNEVLVPQRGVEKLYLLLAALLAVYVAQAVVKVLNEYINVKINLNVFTYS